MHDLVPDQCYSVPVPGHDFGEVQGVCFVSQMNVAWIGQLLVATTWRYVLHIDGTYKLHHAEWVLITLGTHVMAWSKHHKKSVLSFRPLIYLSCKQQETLAALKLTVEAAHQVL